VRGSFGFKAENAPRAYLTGGAKFKGNHKKLYPCLRVFFIDFPVKFSIAYGFYTPYCSYLSDYEFI
jgi:hypothetical protein